MEKLIRTYHITYNVLQASLLPVLFPGLILYGLVRQKYRGHLPGRLSLTLPKVKQKGHCIWIHTMSLGEFIGAKPLITAIQREFPQHEMILSASTMTGLDAIHRDKLSNHALTMAMPYDIYPIVHRVLRHVQPSCFIVVETDLWPNLIWGLKRYRCKLALVNGSISQKSAQRLSRIPGLAQYIYGAFDLLGMLSEDDKDRLGKLLPRDKQVISVGNIKCDITSPKLSKEQKQKVIQSTGFPKGSRIIVAGSTHEPEEKILIQVFKELRKQIPKLRLIIAPRDISRTEHIIRYCHDLGLRTTTRSNHAGLQAPSPEVFILDTLGELANYYSIAHVAFVGGSLAPIGGHNILEPAVQGKPVIFGPYMESFKQIAQDITQSHGGFMVKDQEGLKETISRLLSHDRLREETGLKAKAFVSQNQGTITKYIELLRPIISGKGHASKIP